MPVKPKIRVTISLRSQLSFCHSDRHSNQQQGQWGHDLRPWQREGSEVGVAIKVKNMRVMMCLVIYTMYLVIIKKERMHTDTHT